MAGRSPRAQIRPAWCGWPVERGSPGRPCGGGSHGSAAVCKALQRTPEAQLLDRADDPSAAADLPCRVAALDQLHVGAAGTEVAGDVVDAGDRDGGLVGAEEEFEGLGGAGGLVRHRDT